MFVKICGVTTVDDALLAAGLGADAVGMIFAPSRRRVGLDIAQEITRHLPPDVWSVGVFRDQSREEVVDVATDLGLRAVQLHGGESPADTGWLAQRIPTVIKAFSATDPALARVDEYGPDLLLIDSPTPGSGQLFDWSLLDDAPLRRPFLLAGGLDPDNVVDAIRTVRPWGVDVASGVESSPGRKDPARLRRFLAAVRAVPDVSRTDFDLDRPERPFNWEDDASWR